ncbi:MAG: hypothetical protein A3K19_22930 [Lentisphaerae bacterium RIFOXYB12_FULL_65_16]|nr:MAG: hypothetical protein A3K18_16825 [Lentisphaerae bacterium RIFOXYA12_64_32]OGV90064.1 MAG: hypothetical protein A3K19_22930 [Lentisphaerae bacterium RIFOXYB12_FULL_65_16]
MESNVSTPPVASQQRIPIERFLPHMERRAFRKGDVLFRQGDPADAMFYIEAGSILLSEIGKGLGPGEVIGEMGLLCPANRRTVSAVCEQDLVAYRMGREGVLAMMDRAPRDVFTLIQLAIGRYSENLRHEANARAQMESELRIAQEIQSSSLPSVATAFPGQTAFSLAADMDPAKEVGGDFYDFFLVDANTVFMAVGDVSGKGVPAALFMMTVKTLLKAEAMSGLPPDEVLRRVNRIVCTGNTTFMFVTVLCATLDLTSGRLMFGNAGHCPPLVRQGGGRFEYLEVPPSLVLGFMPDAVFTSGTLTLQPGDAVFLYTDGVTEATNPGGDFYGDERLRAVLGQGAPFGVADLIADVRGDVRRFVEAAPQSDDVTMLTVCFNGRAESPPLPSALAADPTQAGEQGALCDVAHCRMPAEIENISAFHAVVIACATKMGFPSERIGEFELAVEEVLANVARYAYPDASGDVELRCRADNRRFILEFSDRGIPFDVLAKPDPELPSDIAKREIGGLGIYLVKQVMDDVNYRRENDRNILTLTALRP